MGKVERDSTSTSGNNKALSYHHAHTALRCLRDECVTLPYIMCLLTLVPMEVILATIKAYIIVPIIRLMMTTHTSGTPEIKEGDKRYHPYELSICTV